MINFMKPFLSKQKIGLLVCSLVSLAGFTIAYLVGTQTCQHLLLNNFRTPEYTRCLDFYFYTIHNAFYGGYILQSMIIAPLLVLPFSRLMFRVWALCSLVVIPFAFIQILSAPTYARYFDKIGTSKVWGLIYLAVTIGIIILVGTGEWLYRRRQ